MITQSIRSDLLSAAIAEHYRICTMFGFEEYEPILDEAEDEIDFRRFGRVLGDEY